jgi:hypothetical protein
MIVAAARTMKLPNFLIIGTGKAGTTSLYHLLQQHPEIFMSPVKEPNFFAFEGEPPCFRGPGDDRTVNRESLVRWADYCALFAGVRGERALGEASTRYLEMPQTAARIRARLPAVRLVAILRNPVERAFASYLHHRRDGREPCVDFAEALRLEERRTREHWGFGQYLSGGFYHRQLQPYWDLFPASQLRIYLYEDFVSDARALLRDLYRFLDVDDRFEVDLAVPHNVSGVPRSALLDEVLTGSSLTAAIKSRLPSGLRERIAAAVRARRNANLERPPIPPSTRTWLIEAYRDDVLRLQDRLDRDLSAWLRA